MAWEHITIKFNIIQRRFPAYTSYLTFANTIIGLHVPPKVVQKLFEQLVDRKDYLQSEKEQIIQYLSTIT